MAKYIKNWLAALIILSVIILFAYLKVIPKYYSHHEENLTFLVSQDNYKITWKHFVKHTKFILYWIPMWDSKTFSFGDEGYELFRYCEYRNCFATHNRKLIPVEYFDAIVFHAAQYRDKEYEKPQTRKVHQRYIFATMEAPTSAYPDNLKKYKSFYNWTMTYRYDSDIVRTYGYIITNKTNYVPVNNELIKNKTKLAAWFVSNCHTINRREELYRNLRRFLKIDVYGACGKHQCLKENHESSSKCYDLIEQKYKFYFAFENSHCKDYVTEKLYKILKRNIVPVVYGFANYEQLAPPNSVIIADKFSSAKRLANYLLYLNENSNEYLKFFEWKRSFSVETDQNKTVCQLCKMLNGPLASKIYEDIFSWWLGSNHRYCKLGNALPNISIPFQ